jgi:hypothetical protein
MLKRHTAMLRLCRTSLVVGSISAIVLCSEIASAQTSGTSSTTTTTGTGTAPTPVACSALVTTPTITIPSNQSVPERFINGADVGITTRPLGEIQTGISYADCIADMVLQFKTIACGFSGGVNVEVWASTSSSCTADTDRGHGGVAVCWPVGGGSTDLIASDNPENYDVRVQDIVGLQGTYPSPTTYQRQGPSACNTQATSLAVPITVNFIPVNSSGQYVGSGALQFPVAADLVGPPAPTGVGIKDGDTLFVVNWTPNVDTDTAAYDIIMDPVPGGGGASSNLMTKQVCPDAATPIADAAHDSSDSAMSSQSDTDSASDAQSVSDSQSVSDAPSADDAESGGEDATTAAAPATASDAGCRTITVVAGSAGESCNVCNDLLLSGGTIVGGTSSTTTPEALEAGLDDAGNVIDSGVVGPTNGGIWTPPAGHVLNPNETTGSTISGQTNSTYTISGLTNAKSYTVVVAAVDNYGNVGPPSAQACDCPAPVDDFWKTYRIDGGQAGGGFCALEAVGAPAGSTVAFAGAGSLVVATIRRRRRKKR